ncbi:MAG: hypothetical protein CMK32_12220 [Porticoccaceae bacterium]|nr:hypothetical protein [Porticoccaceae bacterium]
MTYDELVALLDREDFEETAAEVHGIICGRLAGGERLAGEKLRNALVESLTSEEELVDNALPELTRLYQQALESLSDASFAFKPLLPGDDVDLGVRVCALGDWAQGFLDGLSDAGLARQGLSEEMTGALEDIAAISQVGYEGDGDNEDETDFAELEEYIRVAAILIFSERASPSDIGAASVSVPRTLH